MIFHRLFVVGCVALLGVASTAAAQDTDSSAGKSDMPGMQHGHGEAMAMLRSPSGAKLPAGMAMVRGTAIQLTLSGDKPGSTRPWHLHKGTCTNDKGIVGQPSSFPPLTIGQNGRGTAKATLGEPLPDRGSYFIAVHASASDMKTIIACGPLHQGGM